MFERQNADAGGTERNWLPRFLIIGAGSRGNAYAHAIFESKQAAIAGVADPIASKRASLGSKYIWSNSKKQEDAEFNSWQDFFKYEQIRRKQEAAGQHVLSGVDGVFVCTLDHTHKEIIMALAPLGLHIMSEKPLAPTLNDCIDIYKTLRPKEGEEQKTVFSIGHVLRYSPHNMLLHKLLLEDKVIGDVLSVEHTEPVGWWHFAHSYVRGNWRKESISANSLMTKSCHDIDFLLWLLCSPDGPQAVPHKPQQVASFGSLSYFKKARKPKAAGNATNCTSCPHERGCMYSAKKIYLENNLLKGNADWPVKIVNPEIEDLYIAGDAKGAQTKLMEALSEDYTSNASIKDIEARPWYGRCVWESDNDVCENQTVTISWKDENDSDSTSRCAKTASFHMVAFTEAQCVRRGRIYGTKGEIEYNSQTIRVLDFASKQAKVHHPVVPEQFGGGHGGGDSGLAGQFVKAIIDTKTRTRSAKEAQAFHIGCTLDDIIGSHAMVFAAEEARTQSIVVDWKKWWLKNVVAKIEESSI